MNTILAFKSEIIVGIISAIVGSFVTFLFTAFNDRRKEKREIALEIEKQRKEAFQNRPEFEITDYKNYLKRTGYGIKQPCDVEAFIVPIDNISLEGDDKSIVNAHYDTSLFDKEKWCCVIYELRNVGKTDISYIDVICNEQKGTCIFKTASAEKYAENLMLNYSVLCDKKIRVGQTVTVKICYHEDCVVSGMFSAIISVGLVDDNNHIWIQPLFAPEEKIYDSNLISAEEYRGYIKTEKAEECFRKPYLW